MKRKSLSDFSRKGFTLAELLMALMVTGIILTSVVTLAYAMGSANDTADDTSSKQARIRGTTVRLSELIRHSKLICGIVASNDIALWRDYDGNEYISVDELVYIERGLERDRLVVWEFLSSSGSGITLSSGNLFRTDGPAVNKDWLISSSYEVKEAQLIPQCSDVRFLFDQPSLPMAERKFVSIAFDLSENGVWRQYQISAALRGWAGYLLDGSGNFIE